MAVGVRACWLIDGGWRNPLGPRPQDMVSRPRTGVTPRRKKPRPENRPRLEDQEGCRRGWTTRDSLATQAKENSPRTDANLTSGEVCGRL